MSEFPQGVKNYNALHKPLCLVFLKSTWYRLTNGKHTLCYHDDEGWAWGAIGRKAQNIKSSMWATEFTHAPTKQRGLYFLWGRQNFITKRCSAPLPSYSWFGSCRFADFYFIFGEILPKSLNNLELINSLFPANSWGPLCSVVWISTGGYSMKLYLLPSNGKAFICSSCHLVPSLKEKHRYIICRNVIILRQFHWN